MFKKQEFPGQISFEKKIIFKHDKWDWFILYLHICDSVLSLNKP